MTNTEYISERVKNAAKNLNWLLDDMAPFNDLKPHWPNAGKFELAQWLERIVDDRRNAVVAHAEHLRLTLETAAVTLTQIAEDFDNTDGDNAQKIKDVLAGLTSKIKGQWDTWDETTEKDHKNFTPSGKDNNRDGDGYNDNLNTPVGHDDK